MIADVVHRPSTQRGPSSQRGRDRRTNQRAGAGTANPVDAPDPAAPGLLQTTAFTPGIDAGPASMRFLEIGLACGAIATAVLIGLLR